MGDEWAITPQTGGEPKSQDVVGRDDAIMAMLTSLQAGNNLLLVDPRRMGKTSLLKRLCNEPGKGVHAVNLSLEGAATSSEVFDLTVKALIGHATLASKAKKALGAFVEVGASAGPVTVKAAFASRNRADLLVDVVTAVEARLDDGETLIVALDEVPLAVRNIVKSEGPPAADVLLQRLRSLRQSRERVRWILAGSIGFHHVLRSANSTEGAVGDLEPVLLGPLGADGANTLARCLLLGIKRPAAAPVVEQIVELTGAIPFLIHHVAHRLNESGTGPVESEHVEAAWTGFIDRDRSKAMTHLVTRLDEYPKLLQPAAKEILDHLAEAANPLMFSDIDSLAHAAELTRDDRLTLVDYLVDDHYLAETTQALAWRYDVLRRIWAARRRTGGPSSS